MVGAVEVLALSDGTIGLDTQLLHTAHRHRLDAALKLAHLHSPLDTSVNAYLLKLADRLILVDAGTGTLFGPSLNKLPASLRAAGVEPEQITDVLITHVHTDHTGGLMSGERRVYPNATLHVDQREIAYWLDPAQEQRAPSAKQAFFQQARAVAGALRGGGAGAPLRRCAAALSPACVRCRRRATRRATASTNSKARARGLMFWGDVMHAAEVQLQDPSVTIAYDVDPAAARAQRLRCRWAMRSPTHATCCVRRASRRSPWWTRMPMRPRPQCSVRSSARRRPTSSATAGAIVRGSP